MGRRHEVLAWGCLAALALALAGCTGTGVGASGGPAERVRIMYESYREDSFPDVPDLSTRQARAMTDSLGLVVLDVREPEERAVSIIPESLDEAGFRALRRNGDRRPVLVYCTIGYRSGLTTEELRDEGIEAYNLRGGILGWIHAGGGVEDPGRGEPVRRVHVHGRRWNLLPDGWEAVW